MMYIYMLVCHFGNDHSKGVFNTIPPLTLILTQPSPRYICRVLFQDPENIIPSELLVGGNTYDDPALVPPFGVEVATNLTTFHLEIQADWPGYNVNRLIRLYSPEAYGGSLMNAYSRYQGDKKTLCNQRQFAEYAANGLRGGVYLYQYGAMTGYDPARLWGLFDLFDNTDLRWASNMAEITMM
jgi:hypothetical protein